MDRHPGLQAALSRADQPIGVLDSGLGGLSVVRALRRLLPEEAIVFLGDTARGPYGDKAPDTIARFTRQAGAALARHTPKLLVIACDAASAHGLAALQAEMACPVIGILEPGALAAAEVAGPVGILGTPATIQAGTLEAAIRRHKPKAVLHALACPLLGALAAEGWQEDPVTDAVCRRYLNQIPFAVHAILVANPGYASLLPSLDRVRANTRWLDAGELTALAVEQVLKGGLGFRTQSARGGLRILLTDLTPARKDAGARHLGEALGQVESVVI